MNLDFEVHGERFLERLRKTKILARRVPDAFDVRPRPTGPSPDGAYSFGGDPAEGIGQLLAMVKELDARLAKLETAEKREAA